MENESSFFINIEEIEENNLSEIVGNSQPLNRMEYILFDWLEKKEEIEELNCTIEQKNDIIDKVIIDCEILSNIIQNQEIDKILRPSDLASLFGCSNVQAKNIIKYCMQARIGGVCMNGHYYIELADVKKFLEIYKGKEIKYRY